MQRITIIGNGGAGKSTLALSLGRATGLPVYHLDRYIWLPGMEAVPEPAFTDAHNEILAGEKWLIEGMGYDSTIEARFVRSDTIIYIDFPIAVHYLWATRRSIKSIFVKPEGWADGVQPIAKLGYIFRILWSIHKKTRPYILSLLSRYEDSRAVHHLRSPNELRQFYARNCNA